MIDITKENKVKMMYVNWVSIQDVFICFMCQKNCKIKGGIFHCVDI